jgi:hypothetical protein
MIQKNSHLPSHPPVRFHQNKTFPMDVFSEARTMADLMTPAEGATTGKAHMQSEKTEGPAVFKKEEIAFETGHSNLDIHEPPKRVICIAIDESRFSENALEWALENIVVVGDLVVLLNVRKVKNPPNPHGSLYTDWTEFILGLAEKEKDIAHRLLQERAKVVKKKGVRSCFTLIFLKKGSWIGFLQSVCITG